MTRWVGILHDLVRAIDEDNCLGLPAQLAFHFLLSLLPALLFLVALVSSRDHPFDPLQDKAIRDRLRFLRREAPSIVIC
ncbi:MAG: hypothetical protein ACRD2I_23010 [Vicinamibacterales bacterium]